VFNSTNYSQIGTPMFKTSHYNVPTPCVVSSFIMLLHSTFMHQHTLHSCTNILNIHALAHSTFLHCTLFLYYVPVLHSFPTLHCVPALCFDTTFYSCTVLCSYTPRFIFEFYFMQFMTHIYNFTFQSWVYLFEENSFV